MHSRIHEFEIISKYFEPKCKSYKSYIVAHKTTQKQFLLTRYNLQMLNMPPKILQERLLFLCKNYKLFRCEAVFFQNHLPSFDVLNPRVISKYITIFYVVEPLPMVSLADYATANVITSDFLFLHLPNVLNTLAAMHSVRFPYLNLSPFTICFDDTLSLRPPPLNPFASEKSLMPPPPKVYRSSFRSINESRFYRAPEWESIDPFCPSDSWSLGTILAEYLIFGGPLFGSLSLEDQMKRTQMILGRAPDFLKWAPPTLTVPCDLPNIILELLDYDPNRRPWLCIHFCQRVLAFIHGTGIKNDENPTFDERIGRSPEREQENTYSGDYSRAQQLLQKREDQEKEERRRKRRNEFDQLQYDQEQEQQQQQQRRQPQQKPQRRPQQQQQSSPSPSSSPQRQPHSNPKRQRSSPPYNQSNRVLPNRGEFLSSSYSEDNEENINGTITISSPISNAHTSPISRPRRPSSSSTQSYTTSYYTYTYTTDYSDKDQPNPNQTMQQTQPIPRPQPQPQPQPQSPQRPPYQSPQQQPHKSHHHRKPQTSNQSPNQSQSPAQIQPQRRPQQQQQPQQQLQPSPQPQRQPQLQPSQQQQQQQPSQQPHHHHHRHQKDKRPEQPQKQPVENPNIQQTQPIIQMPQQVQQPVHSSNAEFEEEEEDIETPSITNTYTNTNVNTNTNITTNTNIRYDNENSEYDSNSSPDTPTLTRSYSNDSETPDTPSIMDTEKQTSQRKSSTKTSSSYQQPISTTTPSNESSTAPTPSLSASNRQDQSSSPQQKSKTKSSSSSSSPSESTPTTNTYTNSGSAPTANTYTPSVSTPTNTTYTKNPTSTQSGSNEYSTTTTKNSSYSYSYSNSPSKTTTSKTTTSKTTSPGYPYSNYESESSSSGENQQPKRHGKFIATEETTKITKNYSQSYPSQSYQSPSRSASQYSSDGEEDYSNHYSFPFSSLAQDGSSPLASKQKHTKVSSTSAPSSTTITTTTTTTTTTNGNTYTTNTDTNTVTSESHEKNSYSHISYSSFDTSQEILNLRERMKLLENSYNQASNEERVEISMDESDSSSEFQTVTDITAKLKKKLTELDERVLNGCNGCDITIQAEQNLTKQEMILNQTIDDASGTTTGTATGSSYTD